MQDSKQKKIDQLIEQLKEVEVLLGQPDVVSDQKKYRKLTQEHSYLRNVNEVYTELSTAKIELADNQQLLKEEVEGSEFSEMLREVLQKEVEFPVKGLFYS